MKAEINIPENYKLINFTHEVKTVGLKLYSKNSAIECFKITDYISKFRSVKPYLSSGCELEVVSKLIKIIFYF